MAQVFADGGFGYSRAFIKQTVLLRSEFLFNMNWAEKLRSDDTYMFYRQIKPYHCFSPYLTELSYHERRCVTRFICRCNFIPCSDYRRHRDPNVNQICNLCDSDSIGNEPHYLLRCPYFSSFRANRPAIFGVLTGNDVVDFANLLQTPDIDVLRSLTHLFSAVMDVCELLAVGTMGGVHVPEEPGSP